MSGISRGSRIARSDLRILGNSVKAKQPPEILKARKRKTLMQMLEYQLLRHRERKEMG